MKFEFPSAVPEIPERAIATAAGYYQNNLGFSGNWGDDARLAGISKGHAACSWRTSRPKKSA